MKTPYILIVDDEEDICNLISEILEEEGYDVGVAYNGAQARALKSERTPDLILLDIWMPDIDGISLLEEWRSEENFSPVIMMSGHGTLEHAIEATKLGASDFLEKPLTLAKLLMVVEKTLEESPKELVAALPTSSAFNTPKPLPFEPIGRSPLITTFKERLIKVAQSQSNLLLTSEHGAPLKGLASYFHSLTAEKEQPFIELTLNNGNLAQLEALIYGDSEEKGLIQKHPIGFLYLSHVENWNRDVQSFIYQFLTKGHQLTENNGALSPYRYRLLFSAHLSLEQKVKSGEFDEALWHLINETQLTLPPLNKHPEDVPELISYYVHYFSDEEHLTYRHFSIAAQNRLRNHHWNGNYLELRNLIKELLILGESEEVTLEEVNQTLEREAPPQMLSDDLIKLSLNLPLREAREQFERSYLLAQYKRAGGNIANLADLVGMERTNLYRKLRSLDIDY